MGLFAGEAPFAEFGDTGAEPHGFHTLRRACIQCRRFYNQSDQGADSCSITASLFERVGNVVRLIRSLSAEQSNRQPKEKKYAGYAYTSTAL
jgi:hypothetical protein